MPSSNAWIRAGVTDTDGPAAPLHADTAANVPRISRFMHNQKPPSSQISTLTNVCRHAIQDQPITPMTRLP